AKFPASRERALAIELAFRREGRAGTRVIRIHTRAENTVSSVSSIRHADHDPRSSQPSPGAVGAAREDSHRRGAVIADNADGADAKPAFVLGNLRSLLLVGAIVVLSLSPPSARSVIGARMVLSVF